MQVKKNPRCDVSLKEKKKHLCKLRLGGSSMTIIFFFFCDHYFVGTNYFLIAPFPLIFSLVLYWLNMEIGQGYQ